jgi:hypothetical protein
MTSDPPPTPAPDSTLMPSPAWVAMRPARLSMVVLTSRPSGGWVLNQAHRQSGLRMVQNVVPEPSTSQRRPRSRTVVVTPAWPSR